MHRSRSLSISKYLPSYWLGSIFSLRECRIITIEKFLVYAILNFFDWLGEATHVPNQNLLRGCWGGIPKEKKKFLLLTETLPKKYLYLWYHPSCWHCCLCGYSCHVLPPPWTVACASSLSAGVWTVCNIFSRWYLAKQHAHSCKGITVLKCVLIFTGMCKACRKLQKGFLSGRHRIVVASGDYYFLKICVCLF